MMATSYLNLSIIRQFTCMTELWLYCLSVSINSAPNYNVTILTYLWFGDVLVVSFIVSFIKYILLFFLFWLNVL